MAASFNMDLQVHLPWAPGLLICCRSLVVEAAALLCCRYISDAEVRESLKTGKVNSRKSNREALPCPKITVDAAVGPNGKHIQNVFNACPGKTYWLLKLDQLQHQLVSSASDWKCWLPQCYCAVPTVFLMQQQM